VWRLGSVEVVIILLRGHDDAVVLFRGKGPAVNDIEVLSAGTAVC
jgi:hypothetical protein